jgi:hypothetical protein
MQKIIIKSKAEFEAALKTYTDDQVLVISEGEFEISLTTSPRISLVAAAKIRLVARGSSQPHVEAWGSSQPLVVARESSQPHVVARESSQPHVVAWESSQPHVVAWESSQPHVEARDSSRPLVVARESSRPLVVAWESSQPQVEAWGSSQPIVEARDSSQPHVVARGYVMLSLHGSGIVAKCIKTVYTLITSGTPKVTGGIIRKVLIKTALDWCNYYGVEVKDGVAVVYKALNDDFTSSHGTSYAPGTKPVADDWDKGKAECGGGLHFSPSPAAALGFHGTAQKYVACYVRLKDIRPPKDNDEYPAKIKAKGCCKPCVEVDITGKPI